MWRGFTVRSGSCGRYRVEGTDLPGIQWAAVAVRLEASKARFLCSFSELAQLNLVMSENGATVRRVCSWSQSSLTHDGLSCSEICLKTNDRRLILQKNNYNLYDISKRTYFGRIDIKLKPWLVSRCFLWNIWVPVHCRNLMWHDTNASPMTTNTSRSLMTEVSQ